jgi:NAD kinase/nicotinic acid mononucleotide adenylyltransferase
MATKSTALYRARFDPPGLHHLEAISALLGRFDEVVVMPWGPLSDRPIDENIDPAFRALLIDVALKGFGQKVVVDLADIENATITSSFDLEKRLASTGRDVFHVVEAEAFAEERSRLHEGARTVVVAPAGASVPPGEFPIVRTSTDVPGAVIRERLYAGQPIDDLVPAGVAALVSRYGLYRGMPRSTSRLHVEAPRLLLVADQRNERAVAWAQRFSRWAVEEDPNLIMVFGGDGSMLHAIQQHWRKRVPFFGVNAGHLGFLLNDSRALADDAAIEALWSETLLVHHMPMLHVELLTRSEGWRSGLTFNDAWVERATGQSAWLEVKVDGQVRLPKVVSDGVLVSTAAGSTAYARSMGASPLLADTDAWLLVGSNVMEPIQWKSSLLSLSSVVEVKSLHVEKRPLNGYLHGVSVGEVTEMRARLSRAASVELAFLRDTDMAEKIARIQFPAS